MCTRHKLHYVVGIPDSIRWHTRDVPLARFTPCLIPVMAMLVPKSSTRRNKFAAAPKRFLRSPRFPSYEFGWFGYSVAEIIHRIGRPFVVLLLGTATGDPMPRPVELLLSIPLASSPSSTSKSLLFPMGNNSTK